MFPMVIGRNSIVSSRARSVPVAKLRKRKKGYHITVVKEAMTMVGLTGGEVRSPLTPPAPKDREAQRHVLKSKGPQ